MNSNLHTIIWDDDGNRISLITNNDGADTTFVCVTENSAENKYSSGEFTADKLVELRDELTRHIALHRVTTVAA